MSGPPPAPPRGSALRRRLHSSSSARVGVDKSSSSSAAAASASTEVPPAPTTYWRVLGNCEAYELPRGAVVMTAPEGQIFEALTYFTDAFGTPWIAVMASNEEVLWLPRYSPSTELTATPTPLLEEVKDEAGSAPASTCGPVKPAIVADAAFHQDASRSPDLATIYGEFWARRDWVPLFGEAKDERDWNSEYQRLIDELVHSPRPVSAASAPLPPSAPPKASADSDAAVPEDAATAAIRGKIMELYTEFADASQDAISTIVGEMFSPQAERTIKAASMGVYFHRGICLQICYDTAGYGGDVNAMKVASQALRAHGHASSVSPKYLLHLPLTFMMTHLGFRVIVTTIPPVSPATRLGQDQIAPAASGPGGLLTDCCRELGLKPHPVAGAGVSPLPREAGVYWGRDGRLYLLNIGRLLPPIAPCASAASQGYDPAISSLFWRLRPEILSGVSNLRPLSSDAFIPGCSTPDDNTDVCDLTKWLRDVNIATVAAAIGMLEPTLAETTDYTCTATGNESRQQLGFVACCREDECCIISPQAYVDVMKRFYWKEDPEGAQELLNSYVKCGANSRQPHGLIMKPDVTTIFHAHGLNMRYLPYVWANIPNLSRPCVSHFLEVEMIARAAKEIVWRSLRQAQSQEERKTVCINFFLALLQHDGDVAEAFWADTLGPAIASAFGIHTPFDTTTVDPFLVHRRISDLTGIELTADSVASFYTDEPFVQLEAPHPCMKRARVPELVKQAGQRRTYLAAHVDSLIALDDEFRARAAPDSTAAANAGTAAEDAALAAAWKALRPAYYEPSPADGW
jgi:hypothetical protein